MSHAGIICPPIPGHLNPFCVLGRSLVQLGHRVTVFGLSDLATKIQEEGLEFVGLHSAEFSAGALADSVAQMKNLGRFESTRFAVKSACQMARLILERAPAAIHEAKVDALLVDQNEPAGGSVAEYLRLPFISICTSLPLNREPCIPPPFTNWEFGRGSFARLRNQLGYWVADYVIRDLQATLNDYRKRWQLPPLRSPNDSVSTLTEIAQMPREFDYPRSQISTAFHYTGPWFDDHYPLDGFPFEKLDGRKIVYASLGTLQSSNSAHFRIIAEACSHPNLQAVISVGAADQAAVPALPGHHIVVHHAPQLELLKRAALTITHAGMNTTMQALHFGCPLVAIPLAHDQPAIAARLKRSGAGIVLSPEKLNGRNLRAAIDAILTNESQFQTRAQMMQQAIQRAGGVERATEIVEQKMLTPRARSARA